MIWNAETITHHFDGQVAYLMADIVVNKISCKQ